MKERIIEFLKAENKSSAQFAAELGVQASGISHIISGRNNPSLDFIMKMLDKYKFLSTEWLLFGKGTMYRDSRMQTLFDQDYSNPELDFNKQEKTEISIRDVESGKHENENQASQADSPPPPDNKKQINRIVWFYSDNSFREFFPEH